MFARRPLVSNGGSLLTGRFVAHPPTAACRHKALLHWHPHRRRPYCSSSLSVWTNEMTILEDSIWRQHQAPNLWGNRSPREDSASARPVLLAFSSKHDKNFLQRLWQNLKKWFQNCIGRIGDTYWIILRSTEVALLFSPLLLLTPAAVISHSLAPNNDWVNHLAWRYTLAVVQQLGPVAIKFGQWVATRRDIFPPQICDRLSVLHDRGRPHSWAHTHAVLVDAFGPDYRQKGLHIDPKDVIGCGSAAQVYHGYLVTKNNDDDDSSTKTPVAVKILHPNFDRLVHRDLVFLQACANLLHPLATVMNLPRIAENFGNIVQLQADLRIEAENLQQFRKNFRLNQEKSSHVVFPQPMTGWVDSQVLVEQYVGGPSTRPIADYISDSEEITSQERKEIAGPLLRAFLKMVFIDNFVHGDLHPGNVFVKKTRVPKKVSLLSRLSGVEHNRNTQEEEKWKTHYSIVFLDAGIASSLSSNDQRNLMDLFRAVLLNDGSTAGRLMVERAKYERCSQTPGGTEAFANGVGELVAEFHDRRSQGLTLGAIDIGSLLSRVLDLCRTHGVEIDPAMSSVVFSTLVLEGLGRSLEPNLNLLDFAKPFVLGFGRV